MLVVVRLVWEGRGRDELMEWGCLLLILCVVCCLLSVVCCLLSVVCGFVGVLVNHARVMMVADRTTE